MNISIPHEVKNSHEIIWEKAIRFRYIKAYISLPYT